MAKTTAATFSPSNSTVLPTQMGTKLDHDAKRATDARRKYQHGVETKRGRVTPRPVQLAPRHPRDFHDTIRSRDASSTQRAQALNSLTRAGPTATADLVDDAFPSRDHIRSLLESDADDYDDFLYSYDHPTGPSAGTVVLGAAVDAAVERFENRRTEALLRDEYSVVDVTEAREDPVDADDDAEDDFELI